MRLAAHTYPFRDRPLGAALDAAVALGVEAVELWVGHAADGPEAAAAAVAARGLSVRAVSVGGFYTEDRDTLDRVVALARAVRAPTVVACLSPPVVAWANASMPDDLVLCVENHWNQPLARSRDVLAALEQAPSLRAALDTGHALLAGERPERAVAALGDRLAHVHLKDARRPPAAVLAMGRRARMRLLSRPAPVAPGTGDLDVAALRAALERQGFTGTLGVEFEGPDPEPALAGLIASWTGAHPDQG